MYKTRIKIIDYCHAFVITVKYRFNVNPVVLFISSCLYLFRYFFGILKPMMFK